MNWKHLFHQLVDNGHSPRDIAEWSYYQVRMVCASEEELTGRRKVPGEVAKASGLLRRRVRSGKVLKTFSKRRP